LLLRRQQAIEIQSQRSLIKPRKKLRLGAMVEPANFVDELTFGHKLLSFKQVTNDIGSHRRAVNRYIGRRNAFA